MLNLGNEQTSSKSFITNIPGNFSEASSEENLRTGHLMNGNDPTTFLPLSPEIGGQVNNNNKPSIGQYLIREQGNLVYKKIELREVINTEILQ